MVVRNSGLRLEFSFVAIIHTRPGNSFSSKIGSMVPGSPQLCGNRDPGLWKVEQKTNRWSSSQR